MNHVQEARAARERALRATVEARKETERQAGKVAAGERTVADLREVVQQQTAARRQILTAAADGDPSATKRAVEKLRGESAATRQDLADAEDVLVELRDRLRDRQAELAAAEREERRAQLGVIAAQRQVSAERVDAAISALTTAVSEHVALCREASATLQALTGGDVNVRLLIPDRAIVRALHAALYPLVPREIQLPDHHYRRPFGVQEAEAVEGLLKAGIRAESRPAPEADTDEPMDVAAEEAALDAQIAAAEAANREGRTE